MKGLGKVHPPDTRVLEDIWLSFYFGAKIGVLGAERRRQELAAANHGRRGHRASSARRFPARASRSGSCTRSRGSIRPKTVLGNVEEGVAPIKALLDALRRGQREARRGSVAGRDGEGPRRAVADPGQDRRLERLGSRFAARAGDGRAAPAAARRRGARSCRAASAAASRSAGCCCSRPTCCCSTSRPTISTPSRSPGSSGSSRTTPGTVVAVTHDRYFLDNVAGWILELDRGRGIPWEGNYSSWLEQKQNRLAQEEKAETQAAADARARARVDPHVAARAAGEGQGAPERLRRPAARGDRAEDRDRRNLHRPRPAARRRRRRGAEPAEGLRRQPADRGPRLHAAARRHRRRHRPERRRQDDAVPDDHRAGKAGRRHAEDRRDGADRLRRSEPRRARRRQDRLGGDHRRRRRDRARQAEGRVARLRVVVQLQGRRRSSGRSARCRAASATASTWRSC